MMLLLRKSSLLAFMFFSVFNITDCYAVVSVGDSYGGGTVFCVSRTPDITQCVPEGSGDYGLIMANEDQVNFDSNPEHGVPWATEYKKTGALSDDDGAANTAAIVAVHPEDNLSNNAAWLCHSYNKDQGQGIGLTNWYLPAKNELNKMYLFARANNLIGKGCAGSKAGGIQCLIGGYNHNMVYWSSSESSGYDNDAWFQYFSHGRQFYLLKVHHCFGVRVVRAFNNLAIQQFKQAMQTVVLGMNERVGEYSPIRLLNQYELQEIAERLGQAVKISGFM